MNKEYKYCKFCGKEKSLEEFVKSGFAIKNICRECNNKKQKRVYGNSKKVDIYKQALNELKDKLLCYGETFDSEIHKQFQKECLEIIDKTKF